MSSCAIGGLASKLARSGEGCAVLVDKCFERRRRPTTNRFDQVVRAGEDPVGGRWRPRAGVGRGKNRPPGGLVPVQTRRTTFGRCVRLGAFAPRRPSSGA